MGNRGYTRVLLLFESLNPCWKALMNDGLGCAQQENGLCARTCVVLDVAKNNINLFLQMSRRQW